MRPRDRFVAFARLAASASQTGAAALGLALLVMSDEPGPRIAAVFVLVLAGVGSLAALENRWSTVACLVVCATLVALARREAGTLAAFGMATVVGLSAWARLRLRDVKVGLAVFGALVVVSAGASAPLVLAFWLVGWIGALLAVRKAHRLTPKTESRELHALKSES